MSLIAFFVIHKTTNGAIIICVCVCVCVCSGSSCCRSCLLWTRDWRLWGSTSLADTATTWLSITTLTNTVPVGLQCLDKIEHEPPLWTLQYSHLSNILIVMHMKLTQIVPVQNNDTTLGLCSYIRMYIFLHHYLQLYRIMCLCKYSNRKYRITKNFQNKKNFREMSHTSILQKNFMKEGLVCMTD